MCTITDFVSKRSVYPPLKAEVQRFEVVSVEVNQSEEGFDYLVINNIQPTSFLTCTNNELLIDALVYGQIAAKECPDYSFPNNFGIAFGLAVDFSLETYEKTVVAFVKKYGLPIDIDLTLQRKSYYHIKSFPIISLFLDVFYTLCVYTKAKYGYDLFENSLTTTKSASECMNEFLLHLPGQSLRFNGSRLETVQQNLGFDDILSLMLADTILYDDADRYPFTCKNCGKPSFRKNIRQIYCSRCSANRAQISRRKNRAEGK